MTGARWPGWPSVTRRVTHVSVPEGCVLVRRSISTGTYTVSVGEVDGTLGDVLHGRALVVDRLVNRRLTRALAADIRSYEPGDIVVFHRDVFGCRANDVCTVMGRKDGRVVLAHADGGERGFRPSGNAATYLGLYDSERIELRAGDRIRWTRNRKAPRPRFGHATAGGRD